MKIEGMYTITSTNINEFYKDVRDAIMELQDAGQIVEVQYQMSTLPDGKVVMSALVIGRKEGGQNDETTELA